MRYTIIMMSVMVAGSMQNTHAMEANQPNSNETQIARQAADEKSIAEKHDLDYQKQRLVFWRYSFLKNDAVSEEMLQETSSHRIKAYIDNMLQVKKAAADSRDKILEKEHLEKIYLEEQGFKDCGVEYQQSTSVYPIFNLSRNPQYNGSYSH